MDAIDAVLGDRISNDCQEISDEKQIAISRNNSNSSNALKDNRVTILKLDGLSGSGQFRTIPIKLEGSMDGLTESEVPVSQLVQTQLSPDSTEMRLALISPQDCSPDQTATSMLVSGGQLFVLSDPNVSASTNPISTKSRSIISRSSESPTNVRSTTNREEMRRVTHNEVERRRRDKINNWICKLNKILNDEPDLQSKSGQMVSKGGILAKACDHIEDLRHKVDVYSSRIVELEKHIQENELKSVEVETVCQQNIDLRNEIARLKAQLRQQQS